MALLSSSYSCYSRSINWLTSSVRTCSCVNGAVQYRQRMSLGIENPSVQRQDVIGREQKVKVLECFCKEEALLYVVVLGRHRVNIFEASISIIRATPLLNCLCINSTYYRMYAEKSNSAVTVMTFLYTRLWTFDWFYPFTFISKYCYTILLLQWLLLLL